MKYFLTQEIIQSIKVHLFSRYRLMAVAILMTNLAISLPIHAQTDEIQVYTGELNEIGKFSITLHSNYTPIGRTSADFPGGVVANHSLNGVAEYALGVANWLELGAYVPLFSFTNDGRVLFNGVKLRALLATPNANDKKFFYGVNFEFSYNQPHWDQSPYSGEIRPIVGFHVESFDFVLNPIIDYNFKDIGAVSFAPSLRIAYNLSPVWAIAVEHYSDFGSFRNFQPWSGEAQKTFAVVDFSTKPIDLELGIGHGFTAASDALVLKLIFTWSF